MEAPKLFISYSWSSPSHEQWVLDLATELRESGIDVILDKWDLKEGHDSVAFMEKMVTDPEISKVIIVTDKLYAAKADGRNGGVGTETQIISKKVYDNQEQDKFVAVVAEKDDEGKPCLPTYYKSRIYIDLSESERYAENFETLLRWIYNKPLYVKPEVGKRPAFLDESEHISLGTSASHKRVISALKENKAFSSGALDEYLELFSSNLEKFRLSEIEGETDDAVIENIEQFIPYRNEAIQLFITISQYAPSDENLSKLHRFFETLIPYMHRPEHITKYGKWDFDNYKFIVHELFLYAVAILVKSERYEQANVLVGQQYYLSGNSEYGRDVMVSFTAFREYMECLERRNQRLELRRLSLRADLLEQRSKTSGIDFRYLMQADFILFMRAEIDKESPYDRWWPETLLYAGRHHGAFEVFARSISRAYFDKVKCLLNIQDPADLTELLNLYRENWNELPRWQFDSFSPSALLGFEQLAAKA
ncbi:SEFIR domain-containing protein [Aeromonas schubertii]|uniref:SEFIR domain-containing protein n=1 Tax=Aeromonas schubertii TaxID=652 RepID=UPI0038B51624